MTEDQPTSLYPIAHRCPTCKKDNSLSLSANRLICQNTDCSFKTNFLCPICNADLSTAAFSKHKNHDVFKCPSCKRVISLKKIQYLLDNHMMVDHNQLCSYCNSPTIHRKTMNLSNRCFFFPLCSGQGDLFGQEKESLTFLDFETTGLDPITNEIIEIGALKIDEEGYEYPFQSFVKPRTAISARITQITGITDEIVTKAPDIKTAIAQLAAFIGTSKIVIHNADFDTPFLISALIRNQVPIQTSQVICTLIWARKNGETRSSLGVLAKKYSLSHENAHRALADAATTKELFFIYENNRKIPRPTQPLQKYWTLTEKLLAKTLIKSH